MKRSLSRIGIFWIWLCTTSILLLASSAIASFYWANSNGGGQLNVLDELIGMSAMLPVGLFVSLIAPVNVVSKLSSWLIVLCVLFACKTKKPNALIISAAGSVLFGLWWPSLYWQITSV